MHQAQQRKCRRQSALHSATPPTNNHHTRSSCSCGNFDHWNATEAGIMRPGRHYPLALRGHCHSCRNPVVQQLSHWIATATPATQQRAVYTKLHVCCSWRSRGALAVLPASLALSLLHNINNKHRCQYPHLAQRFNTSCALRVPAILSTRTWPVSPPAPKQFWSSLQDQCLPCVASPPPRDGGRTARAPTCAASLRSISLQLWFTPPPPPIRWRTAMYES